MGLKMTTATNTIIIVIVTITATVIIRSELDTGRINDKAR